MNAGPKELNEGFVRSLPDNGPVVMVDLLRFKRSRLTATAQGGNPTRVQQSNSTAHKGGRGSDALGR